MKTLTITKQRFLDWYYEQVYTEESEQLRLNLAEQVLKEFYEKGKTDLTVKDIFEKCNQDAIRAYFTEEYNYQTDEYDVELSDLGFEYNLILL